MRILVISNMYPDANHPGYGVFVKNFCTQLDELGVDYSLAVMKKADGKAGKALGYLKFYITSFLKCLLGSWDLVYVHYASHSSPGVLLARCLRHFRIFTNVHGSDVMPENPRQERFQRFTEKLLACSETIVAPSSYFAACVVEKYGVPENKVFVCPSGGVDTAAFCPGMREENTLFTFGTVSRISAGKGWDTLLQACAAMPDTNYKLIWAGDGPERKAMEAMITELGLTEQITLVGEVSHKDLPEIYRGLDGFVFPTRLRESLGLVALEAMACGVPVIASDIAAPADYVCPGINGYKFPVGNHIALRDAMVTFRTLSEAERAALQEGAVTTAAGYSRVSATKRLEQILR